MKKVKLKSLTLENFKGIKKITVTFSDVVTTISGRNGSGKSTIYNAWLWLITGKDSLNRSDYMIKTVGLREANHSVTAYISVDGVDFLIKRTLFEKWSRPKGAAEKVFVGNTTEYYINNETKKKNEFESFLMGLFDFDKFTILSDPLYFLGLSDPGKNEWKKQRDILMSLLPNDIELKAVPLAALKAKNKEIDELNILISSLKLDTTDYLTELESFNPSKKQDYLDEIETIEREVKREVERHNGLCVRKTDLFKQTISLRNTISANNDRIDALSLKKSSLLAEYNRVKNCIIAQSEFVCSECGTVIEGDKALDMVSKKELGKVEKIKIIIAEGKSISHGIENIKVENFRLNNEAERVKKEYDSIDVTDSIYVNDVLAPHARYNDLKLLAQNEPGISRRKELENLIAVQKKDLERHNSLKTRLLAASQELITLEKEAFDTDNHNKIIIESAEKHINNLFKTVKLSLYDYTIGGEGKEICRPTIGGVEFAAANNAGRIIAGVETIGLLGNLFKLQLPIFIDNAESISSDIPNIGAQIVLLKVDNNDLTIKK